MKISRLGEAPDYRFSLANERTFLAWIRTSLGFFAGGLAIYGYIRWLSNEKAMRLKQDLPYTRTLLLISILLTLVIVVVMALVLYAG